jgi:hypothetical protein
MLSNLFPPPPPSTSTSSDSSNPPYPPSTSSTPPTTTPPNDLFDDFKTRVNSLPDSHSESTKYKGKNFATYAEEMKDIINHFSYPDDGDKSTVMDRNVLVNAFFANDLYKLSMAPVIDKCSKDSNGCVVQFRLDLRTNSTFNETLKSSYVTDVVFRQDLALQLNEFTKRIFDEKTGTGKSGPIW